MNVLPENPLGLFNEAELKHDFTLLLQYPKLLYFYQRRHSDSVKEIAKIASHKLGNHKYCVNDDDCTLLDFLVRGTAEGEIKEVQTLQEEATPEPEPMPF